MSYPLDIPAQNAALDALLSRDISGLPTEWEVALYAGDPDGDGTELTSDGGYARVVINADMVDWAAAADGEKLSMLVDYGAPTGPWSDVATHYLLIDHADSATRWYPGLLVDALTVIGTELTVKVQLSQYWNTVGVL